MYLKYYLLSFLVFSFLLTGCSSKETVKEKEVKKNVEREVVPPKKVLNFDMREREFVHSNKIMVIDKLRFDYDKNDKLNLIGKVSTANYDNNGFLIQDLNTKNGTEVNGEKLVENEMKLLSSGDDIMVGKTLNMRYKEKTS